MDIRGPVLLPARREDIELHTVDELTLVGELALPAEREPVATLVTSGPFRVSRNPMYTGHAVSLVGAALWAGSWWVLAADALAVLATRQLVIAPEEDYLTRRFGDQYETYRSRVRRWL